MVEYADGPTTHVEVHVDAPPSAVWPLMCDIDLPARLTEELRRAEWFDDVLALGATFRGGNRHELVGDGTRSAPGLTPEIEHTPDLEEQIVGRRQPDRTANVHRTVLGIAGLAEDAAGPAGR